DSGASVWITPGEVNQWIQEAHNELAETKYYKDDITTDLVDEQWDYDISALNIMEIERIWRLEDGGYDAGSAYLELKPIPYHQLKRWTAAMETAPGGDAGGVNTSEGSPSHYCWHGDFIYLYPSPNYDEVEGLRLEIACCQTMDEDTDTTNLPFQFETLITYYGLAQAYAKERNVGLTQYYLMKFDEGKGRLSEYVTALKGGYPERIDNRRRSRAA
ncbi:unnamed protein product, partial [marine sediment metagenome]